MNTPHFAARKINLDSYAIDHANKTIAIVTPQGYVDWIEANPDTPGKCLRAIEKETHLGWVLGLKFNLHFCHLTETMRSIVFEPRDSTGQLCIIAHSCSKDGALAATHRATLDVDPDSGRYRWTLQAELRNVSDQPVKLRGRFIEYTNLYPSGCGRCMLFAPEKRFDRTLMRDADGVTWCFPHQHFMHYGHKVEPLRFARGAIAGFFGEAFNPVVTVQECDIPPSWTICDMFFDLHCGLSPEAAQVPVSGVHRVRATIEYWDKRQAETFAAGARYIPITADDYKRWHAPRLELGRNDFSRVVCIDDVDDASGFPQQPPVKVWDTQTGPEGKGSLRLTNETPVETVWSAIPPTQIPPGRRFRLAALARLREVKGKGLYLRIRYHNFEWRPTPHVEWEKTLASKPVAGDTGEDWIRITTPELVVPANRKDRFVWLDIVLDGSGVAWVTDMDVNLQTADETNPIAPVIAPKPGGRRPVGPVPRNR